MNYSSISIQGNILSSEVLENIRTEDIRFQQPKDFNLDPNTTVRDEISLAWSLATSHWKAFKQKREQLSAADTGTTETRNYWMKPLMAILGYDLVNAQAELINGKSYAISFRATNLDEFPVHIVGINQSLDTRAESGGPRLSPHALAQEYLNNQEHLYALVSNGKFLRLLRDATRLSRLSYLEFNLEQMMEESLYAEFALLFRLLHASRMPQKKDDAKDSILEFYHQEALASGSRIRERLSMAVETSIKELANGFLQHDNNEALRQAIAAGRLEATDFYVHNLRIIYRLLFLMVIEERKLIYPASRDEQQEQQRDIYYKYYSVQRLCRLVEKAVYVDPNKTDLWQSLATCFQLFENSRFGQQLGIAPLGSGLFAPDALGIMGRQTLNNETVLKVLRHLVTFENENGQRVRVNYADLDVEEFGSVYEGLLEYKPEILEPATHPHFLFKKGNERSKSGSHYTPEELVKPLIQHSLDYLIEERIKTPEKFVTSNVTLPRHGGAPKGRTTTKDNVTLSLSKGPDSTLAEQALLGLKVCDVACGSGHILLSAARRIGFELAKLRSKEDQPSPTVLRQAIRDTINHCIYGVDKNPLAVELCKVAMWLEAHNPGEPLNFLDHHIKCGDAIVGLAHKEELEKGIADEAFKTLPGDDKNIASSFLKRNKQERKQKEQGAFNFDGAAKAELDAIIEQYNLFKKLPERTPEEIANKEKQYRLYEQDYHRIRLRQLADAQVAQFFIPKTDGNKPYLLTDAEYRNFLRQVNKHLGVLQSPKLAKAQQEAIERRFFHWFLEFPEVLDEGGFDCVLGNPPFLGGQKISGSFGDSFLECIKYEFAPIGAVDLVTFFFRRIFGIISNKAFMSLISTKTIAEGDVRLYGLAEILKNGGEINFAIKKMRWPGEANVEISLSTTNKGKEIPKYLADKSVSFINSFLSDGLDLQEPIALKSNSNQSFQGSIILGDGFILDENTYKGFIESDQTNSDVLFEYKIGNDLNSNFDQKGSRYVINFFDWSVEKARKYEKPFNRVYTIVKPDRESIRDKKTNLNARDIAVIKDYWQYESSRPNLYSSLKKVNSYLQISRAGTKFVCFSKGTSLKTVFADTIAIVTRDEIFVFGLLNSSIFDSWSWKYCTIKGGSTLRFAPSTAYETFPFPQETIVQNNISNAYDEFRNAIMQATRLGLTDIYNLFHSNAITAQAVKQKDKQVAALQKHLEKKSDTISFNEAIAGIVKLRELHVQMDNAVLDAYGWSDLQLKHDFYEVDYLPENDRWRYTIHPDARKEVLKRLLELNHKIHDEEVKAGLWDKKKGKVKTYTMNEDQPLSQVAEEPDSNYGPLFNQK